MPCSRKPRALKRSDAFRASFPFHPDVLATLTGKTSTLVTFQRVRGMLRLLAGTVAYLWKTRPADATAIHLHHIDPGFAPIYEEIATRLGQRAYVPAIRNDIVAAEPGKKALAQDIDDAHYHGMAPYATYVARTIFIHTPRLQRSAKRADARASALLDHRSGNRHQLHR